MSYEEWRPIPTFDGYEASNLGNVRRTSDKPGVKRGALLKQNINHRGYPFVQMTIDRKHFNRRVHRLVLAAFCGYMPDDDVHCNHINGIKSDSRLENLEWCTRSENAKHAINMGLMKPPDNRGHRGPGAKLTVTQVSDIRVRVARGEKRYRIAREMGVSPTTVGHIVARRTWTEVA